MPLGIVRHGHHYYQSHYVSMLPTRSPREIRLRHQQHSEITLLCEGICEGYIAFSTLYKFSLMCGEDISEKSLKFNSNMCMLVCRITTHKAQGSTYSEMVRILILGCLNICSSHMVGLQVCRSGCKPISRQPTG